MGKQNMSNKEKKALNLLIKNRNVKVCVNDTDKNLGAITTDKCDVIRALPPPSGAKLPISTS